MQITIVPSDGVVGVDGVFRPIDLSNIDSDIHAVQYNTATETGHIEYVGSSKPNKEIGQGYFTNAFSACVDIWNSLTPQPEPPHVPTPEEIKASFINAVQGQIDAVARSRGYDSGVSLTTYATDTHPPFASEAAAFIPWRSTVWLYCYTEWAKFEAGLRTFTTPEAFVAELPAITWPT